MPSDRGHDRYELVERIAVGGMAEVFLAKTFGSHGFEKTLAIKRILPDLASAPEFERRFIAEAKIAVTLNHANIVQVLDFSKFGESLYIAMEFVDGMDVAALLEERPQLPLPAGLHLAMEMLKGLDFAHRRGVVHRDVSPSNVLVSRAGEVKIADFGIAQATNAGVDFTRTRRIMGKWRYMSPEQTRGDELDVRSDLFSAGAVIYEVLTGQKLFSGNDAETIVRNITSMPIPSVTKARPSLPKSLDDVLGGLLTRKRDKRTAKASEALNALVDISYQRSVQATAMSLADVVAEVAPPSRDPSESDVSANLIDDIINSELESGRSEGKRKTLADDRMPEFDPEDLEDGMPGLTFVGSGTNAQGITQWVVEPTIVKPLSKSGTLPLGLVGAAFDDTQPPSPISDDVEDFGDDDETIRRRGTEQFREPSQSYIAPVKSRWGWVAAVGVAILVGGGIGVAAFLGRSKTEVTESTVADAAPAPVAIDSAAPVEPSEIAITSKPEGAAIVVDGQDTGKVTPAAIALRANQTVELSRDGYEPCRVTFEGDPVDCELEASGALLTVSSRPSGAEVTLDGKSLGKTPIANLSVPAKHGEATLKLHVSGYRDQTRKLRLVAGKQVNLEIKLVEKSRTGTIAIYVEPWAHVYLRGKKIGTAPIRKLELPVGRHRLRLTNPVQKRSTTITVSVPRSKPYRVKLPASK